MASFDDAKRCGHWCYVMQLPPSMCAHCKPRYKYNWKLEQWERV